MANRLTPMQEKFAQEFHRSRSASDAARKAGYKFPDQAAAKLMRTTKVLRRINESEGRIVADVEEEVVVKRSFLRKALLRELSGGVDDDGEELPGDASARLKAIQMLGSEMGMWLKRELREDGKNLEDILAEADRLDAGEEKEEELAPLRVIGDGEA